MKEMESNKKIREMMRILNYVYSQSKTIEVTPALAKIWIDQVHGFSLKQSMSAAKMLMREKTFGEPRFCDFWECLKKVAAAPRRYNPWNEEPQRFERAADICKRLEIEKRKLIS